MVAGLTSGSGKTTITQGILSILVTKGLRVRSFKLGPDYIDSAYHAKLTGNPCINLDKFLMTPYGKEDKGSNILKDVFSSYLHESDALVVEAVGGIFDDWNNDGNNPAQIAIDIELPVILVADGYSYCQTLGIMLNSVLEYNKKLQIEGVLINRIACEKQFYKILETMRPEIKSKVIGFVPNDNNLFIEERHLGLITERESDCPSARVEYLAKKFLNTISEEFLTGLKFKCHVNPNPILTLPSAKKLCKIAVGRDKAFSFYYQYNLDFLEKLGADLFFFSPLKDKNLPDDIDALYLGGGFPEVYASSLENNSSLALQIKTMALNGMPIYAECGGLIYLSEKIQEYQSDKMAMGVGILPLKIFMGNKLTLSYATGKLLKDSFIGEKGDVIKGHLFHQSDAVELRKIDKVCEMQSPDGQIKIIEGFCLRNVYASYLHIHFMGCPKVAEMIVRKASEYHSRNH